MQLELPKAAPLGKTVEVKISHKLPVDLGEQLIHVTLKDGNGQRIERQVLKAQGEGVKAAQFKIPAEVPGGKVHFAAFIGKDFPSHLQYLTPDPIAVD
jgi:hypothetical protein